MSLMDDLKVLSAYGVAGSVDAQSAYERLKAHLESTTPWYPPVPAGYREWIEYKVGDIGPRVGEFVSILTNYERENKRFTYCHAPAYTFNWQKTDIIIVAYCIKEPDVNQ